MPEEVKAGMPEDGRQLISAPSASHGTRLAGLRSIISVAGPGAVPRAGDPRKEPALARVIRAREMVAGKSPAAIAAIIRRECEPAYGTTWIRAYRLALGIALADVVAQVRAYYEAEGRNAPRFSETLLSAYESGQKRPGPEYLHYLCAVYRADPPELGYEGRCFCGRMHAPQAGVAATLGAPVVAAQALPDERAGLRVRPAAAVKPLAAVPAASLASAGAALVPRQRSGAGRGGAGGSEMAGGGTPGDGTPGDDAGRDDALRDNSDALRGMLLALITDAGAAVDSRFFGAADCLRRQMDDALLGRTVSVTMLDQWEESTAGYGAQYMTVPPLRLLCDVLLDFGDIRRMCAQLARSFFRTARTAADETGDRRLRAWVAVREALVPLYYGDPRQAAALARTGTDLAGRQPCAAGVMAPVIEARALARIAGRGRREATDRARSALDRAHDALGELPTSDRDDTAFGYTERQLFFHQGDTLVTLGDYQGATRAFAQASRMYSRAEFLDRALVMFGAARCLAEADEPEHALRVGQDTLLGLPRQQRTEIASGPGRPRVMGRRLACSPVTRGRPRLAIPHSHAPYSLPKAGRLGGPTRQSRSRWATNRSCECSS